MIAANTTRRICAGEYERTDGKHVVAISRVDFGYGEEWIATAKWDASRCIDPVPTKRDATFYADSMLESAA